MAYLDENGLEHFWGKIKNHVDSAVAPKADDADVVHKTGDEVIVGEKVFADSRVSASGAKNNIITLKDEGLTRGTVPSDAHYSGIGIIDSQGSSYPVDGGSRLAALVYKAPSSGDLSSSTFLQTYKFDGSESVNLEVGYDVDGRAYAKAPKTSDERTNSTDIVTRGYMEASEWNWQKTKKNALVQFKSVPESDLEPVVDFMFTETPPASGDKGPENPSTITGVSSIGLTRTNINLLLRRQSDSVTTSDITFTCDGNGSYTATGVASGGFSTRDLSTQNFKWNLRKLPNGRYILKFKEGLPQVTIGATITRGGVTGYPGYSQAENIITLYEDTTQCVLYFYGSAGKTYDNAKISPYLVLEGSDAVFEIPQDDSYTIQLGDTYYGGSLDVATGVMTKNWNGVAMKDLVSGVATWYDHPSGTHVYVFYVGSSDGVPDGDNSTADKRLLWTCTHFSYFDSSSTNLNFIIVSSTSSVAYVQLEDSYLDLSGAVDPSNPTNAELVAAMKALATSEGWKLVYPLAASSTVQLTPTQIRSLPALDKYEPRVNTVYTDQEAVQVGYQRYANYVDLTTDQQIFGKKRFVDYVFASNNADTTKVPQIRIEDSTFLRGDSAPSSEKILGQVVFCGWNQNFYGNLNSTVWTDGSVATSLTVFKNIESNSSAALRLVYPANGSAYATAPSTPDTGSNNDILTRNWIPKDTRIVHTTGDEDIAGAKRFTSSFGVKSLSADVTNASTTQNHWLGYGIVDKNNALLSNISLHIETERSYSLRLYDSSGTQFWIMLWSLPHDGSHSGSYVKCGSNFIPTASNSLSLGSSSLKWKEVWAQNGTIQTSDERLKTDIDSIPDEVLDSWAAVEWKQFRLNDAVEKKGELARLHTGIVAQHADAAFSGTGLNASKYGFFCFDKWDEIPAQLDEQGNVAVPAIPAGEQYSIRYDEALALEAAYMRRENARLKKRVADLEERLAALELRLGSE